ncbi:hypothetical protein E3N88_35801 [Mikania micrantha]|uniref:Uncharacterized protein n=1 Tax=Mikania micrantha TaxID=192012 RepID=A0A5N6M2F7_9ASTR|nr:hypothetical protein E3N88_35801 [Mikania micrantha]
MIGVVMHNDIADGNNNGGDNNRKWLQGVDNGYNWHPSAAPTLAVVATPIVPSRQHVGGDGGRYNINGNNGDPGIGYDNCVKHR